MERIVHISRSFEEAEVSGATLQRMDTCGSGKDTLGSGEHTLTNGGRKCSRPILIMGDDRKTSS